MREQTHLSSEIINRFHEDALKSTDKREIYDHLRVCDPCRILVVDERVEQVALGGIVDNLLPPANEDPFHLEYEEIDGYVDGKLDDLDRSRIELHLKVCDECSAEARDLDASLKTMQALSAHKQSESVRGLPTVLLNPRHWFGPSQLALVTGIILLASAVIVIQKLRSQAVQNPNLPIAEYQSTPPPTPTPSQAPSPSLANNKEKPPSDRGANGVVHRQENVTEPAQVVALIDGPRKITLLRSGTLNGVSDLPVEMQEETKAVLQAQSIAKPDVISDLQSNQLVLRGSSGDEQTISPLSPASVITEDNPVFKWVALEGATGYQVVVGDPNFRPIIRSDRLPATVTEWKAPSGLPRGVIYTWMVKATTTEDQDLLASSAPLKFKVLEEAPLNELVTVRKTSHSHLALGIFYARAGMVAEAKQELELLLRDNPKSLLAKRLLAEVKSWQ